MLPAGIAVNALGHGDARWQAALTSQAAKLSHTSNLFHTVPQVGAEKGLHGEQHAFSTPAGSSGGSCLPGRAVVHE